MPLRTDRLVLRHYRAEDVDVLLAYNRDPNVVRYCSMNPGPVPTQRSRSRNASAFATSTSRFSDRPGMHRVKAQPDPHNIASTRLCERLV